MKYYYYIYLLLLSSLVNNALNANLQEFKKELENYKIKVQQKPRLALDLQFLVEKIVEPYQLLTSQQQNEARTLLKHQLPSETLKRLSTEIHGLTASSTTSKGQQSILDISNEKADKLARLENENAHQESQLNVLTPKLDILKNQYQELTTRNKQLMQENQQKNRELTILKNEVTQLTSRQSQKSVVTQAPSKMGAINALKRQNKALQEELNKLQTQQNR